MELQRACRRVFRLLVVVGNDDDIGAEEQFVVLRAPFVDAAWHCGRHEAEGDGGVGVALAFADQRPLTGFHRRDERRATDRALAADALEVPYPAARAIRSALAKTVVCVDGVEAHDLEQERPAFIVVRVGCDDGSAAAVALRGGGSGTRPILCASRPRVEKRLSPELSVWAGLSSGRRGRATRRRGVRHDRTMFVFEAECLGGVGVVAVPAEFLAVALVRFAPQFEARRFAEVLEIRQVVGGVHARPRGAAASNPTAVKSRRIARRNEPSRARPRLAVPTRGA